MNYYPGFRRPLREQAFEANSPWIGREAGERHALTLIGHQRMQPLTPSGIKAISDSPQHGVIVRGTGRAIRLRANHALISSSNTAGRSSRGCQSRNMLSASSSKVIMAR